MSEKTYNTEKDNKAKDMSDIAVSILNSFITILVVH